MTHLTTSPSAHTPVTGHHRCRGDERGQASIEWAIVFPVLLLVIFTVVQAAGYYHAKNAAQSAAAACAEHARAEGSSSAQGRQSATSIISQSGAIASYTVDVNASATQVSCTVSGQAHIIIDLGLASIRQTVTMPKDRATRP